jgi:hypothetical protein
MKRTEVINQSFEELRKTEEFLNESLKRKRSILKYLENELLNDHVSETNQIEFSTSEEEIDRI